MAARTVKTLALAGAGVAAFSVIGLSNFATPTQAQAMNSHSFCNASTSYTSFVVANNTLSGTAHREVWPGQCKYGDWWYTKYGTQTIRAGRVYNKGWNYDGAFFATGISVRRA